MFVTFNAAKFFSCRQKSGGGGLFYCLILSDKAYTTIVEHCMHSQSIFLSESLVQKDKLVKDLPYTA